MDIILITAKVDNSVTEENPLGITVTKFVTQSQLDKIIETWGEDYSHIPESEVDNITNNYP